MPTKKQGSDDQESDEVETIGEAIYKWRVIGAIGIAFALAIPVTFIGFLSSSQSASSIAALVILETIFLFVLVFTLLTPTTQRRTQRDLFESIFTAFVTALITGLFTIGLPLLVTTLIGK